MCLDNTFSGWDCLQGPVALTHQPNCPLCSFSFKIVGDVGCSYEIVKICARFRGHDASHIFESHSLDSFQSFSVGFVLHSSVMFCYVMLCYVMLCYIKLCYVMLCYVVYEVNEIFQPGVKHVMFKKLFIRIQFVKK